MKRLLISLLAVGFAVTSFSLASFTASVSLDDTKETKYIQTVDTVLDAWVRKQGQTQVAYKFPTIHERIEKALDKSGLSKDIIFFLEYLDRYVLDWLENNVVEEEEETTTNTNTSTSSTNSKEISPSDYDEGEKQISSNGLSDPVVKFEITADLEDIQVNEFSIVANSSTLDDVIEKIYVYDEDGDLIGSDRPNNDRAEFTETVILEEGDNVFYIALLPKNRDDIDLNQEFSFEMHITDAESTTNGNEVNDIIVENDEDIIRIARATVGGGGIQLLETYNHRFVDSKIYNQARADLAIISVDFSETEGNDDIVLESLEFTLDDGTVAGDVHTTLELKRIDNVSDAISLDSRNGNQVTFDLNDLGNKQIIKAGSTVVFLVTGVPLLDSTQSEFIKIELDPRETDDGIITYSTEDDSSITTTTGHPYVGKIVIAD